MTTCYINKERTRLVCENENGWSECTITSPEWDGAVWFVNESSPDRVGYDEISEGEAEELQREWLDNAAAAASAIRAGLSAFNASLPEYAQVFGNPPQLTVCLLGDDRARDYRVAWLGTADLPGSGGESPVALVLHQDHETLVAYYAEHLEWGGVGNEVCRDFVPADGYPAMDDTRLQKAY